MWGLFFLLVSATDQTMTYYMVPLQDEAACREVLKDSANKRTFDIDGERFVIAKRQCIALKGEEI